MLQNHFDLISKDRFACDLQLKWPAQQTAIKRSELYLMDEEFWVQPLTAACRSRICPLLQLREAAWTSTSRPHWLRRHAGQGAQPPRSDRRNRRCEEEPGRYRGDRVKNKTCFAKNLYAKRILRNELNVSLIFTHPLSLACTSAPWCSRYSTTDTLL